ncbi:MAG: tRNA pseudouridine(38-40) synthase TruA, partial [Caldilineaceae bacterium]|nr:tRNA pseudouridine(38-40) synthase TruA [Caldilineaceae bacterium]
METPTLEVCALVAYDGTDYHGFQYQVGVPTIQGALEDALGAVALVEGRVAGAGRTDSGVHARGQVVSILVRWRHPLDDLQRAWNAHLPPDIGVRRLRLAPPGFHPRFSAKWRTYRYTVFESDDCDENPPRTSPLTDRFAHYERQTLDVGAMSEAALCFLGRHDFATFGQPPQGENSVRQVIQADWQVVTTDLPGQDVFPGRCLVFTVTANAFLRQMVRNMVEALLEVGRGRWGRCELQSALEARSRACSPRPAPAQGLVLEYVEYPASMN